VWLHQVGDRDLSAEFLNFGADDFPFKIPFKKCFNIVFFCFGVEIHPVLELEFLTRLRVVLLCFSMANRIVMAASRLLGAAAARVILLSFAAGHRTG